VIVRVADELFHQRESDEPPVGAGLIRDEGRSLEEATVFVGAPGPLELLLPAFFFLVLLLLEVLLVQVVLVGVGDETRERDVTDHHLAERRKAIGALLGLEARLQDLFGELQLLELDDLKRGEDTRVVGLDGLVQCIGGG
jgi:hypothetical protein